MRVIASNGYVLVKARDNPMADVRGYVYEHRLVASQALGRTLSPTETVHHINGDRLDNRAENLQVVSQSEHAKHHARERGSLSDEEIVDLVLEGTPSDTIARDYRVTQRRIVRIRREIIGLAPFQQVRKG